MGKAREIALALMVALLSASLMVCSRSNKINERELTFLQSQVVEMQWLFDKLAEVGK